MISEEDKNNLPLMTLNECVTPSYVPISIYEDCDSMAKTMYEKEQERDSLIKGMRQQIEDLSQVVNVLWREATKEKGVKRKFPGDGS